MSKPLYLLLVEDSEDDALLLILHLERNGYTVHHVRVQTEAALRSAITSATWDIIISDYSMPRFSGGAALQIAQELAPDIPFVIVSGAIGEERAVDIMRQGANDYVMKNNLPRLVPTIERELREAAQHHAHQMAEQQIHILSRALAQSASLMIITATDDTIVYVNNAFLRVTGYSETEIYGQPSRIIFSAQTDPQDIADCYEHIHNGQDWHGEIQATKADTSTYWAALVGSAIRNPDETIGQYLFVLEDISERKRLAAELQGYTQKLEQMVDERTSQLKRAKEQIEVILNTSSDGIVLALSSGDIQTINPAFRALFENRVNRSIEEIIYMLSSEEDMTQIADSLMAVLYDKDNQRRQVGIIQSNGETIDVDFVFNPIDDGHDKGGLVLSVRDITHFKELERFRDEFLENTTHDLGNPIASLRLQIHMLRKRPDRLNKHLEAIEAQTTRLEKLVLELRTLSEIDRRIIKVNRQLLDFNPFVQHVVENHRTLAHDRRHTLTFTAQDDLPPVYIDADKFERVVANLLTNAINYTSDGGSITVATDCTDTTINLTVADTGQGIAAVDLPHIFNRFYRTQRARKTSMGGSGIGLAIVKELVEAHSGTIAVQSVVDAGTTFTVLLPIVPQATIPDIE
jgi:PAS domain S-box-containing protein